MLILGFATANWFMYSERTFVLLSMISVCKLETCLEKQMKSVQNKFFIKLTYFLIFEWNNATF